MECRAYGICLDSQSRGYLGKDRKVSSAAGGNLSRMHKTEETAKESRLNFMYSHLRNRTLVAANHQPSKQLANTTPNSRVDLDVERRTNEQHQKTCFQLFHRKHLPNSILDASSRQILVISFRRGCYKLRCSE